MQEQHVGGSQDFLIVLKGTLPQNIFIINSGHIGYINFFNMVGLNHFFKEIWQKLNFQQFVGQVRLGQVQLRSERPVACSWPEFRRSARGAAWPAGGGSGSGGRSGRWSTPGRRTSWSTAPGGRSSGGEGSGAAEWPTGPYLVFTQPLVKGTHCSQRLWISNCQFIPVCLSLC